MEERHFAIKTKQKILVSSKECKQKGQLIFYVELPFAKIMKDQGLAGAKLNPQI